VTQFQHAILTSDPAEFEEAKALLLRLARGRNKMRGAARANAQLDLFTRVAQSERWTVDQQLAMALAFVVGKDLGPQLGTYASATVDDAWAKDHLLAEHDYEHVTSAGVKMHDEDHASRDDLNHIHEKTRVNP
jgi:hypothetical protein